MQDKMPKVESSPPRKKKLKSPEKKQKPHIKEEPSLEEVQKAYIQMLTQEMKERINSPTKKPKLAMFDMHKKQKKQIELQGTPTSTLQNPQTPEAKAAKTVKKKKKQPETKTDGQFKDDLERELADFMKNNQSKKKD